jgi:hypothetical protein
MTTNNHSRPDLRLATPDSQRDTPGHPDSPGQIPATPFNNGRFTRAAIHCEAGELELKLNPYGNWQLKLRAEGDRDWRLACSGDLSGGDIALPEPETAALRFGKLLLDRDARRVLVEGSEVKLSARQYELLEALSIHPERVIAKADLARRAWGWQSLGTNRTLDIHASRARAALRRAGAEGFVINCRGVGYKLWNGTGVEF